MSKSLRIPRHAKFYLLYINKDCSVQKCVTSRDFNDRTGVILKQPGSLSLIYFIPNPSLRAITPIVR